MPGAITGGYLAEESPGVGTAGYVELRVGGQGISEWKMRPSRLQVGPQRYPGPSLCSL